MGDGNQRIHAGPGDDDDMPSIAPVSPVGTATRNETLATETDASVTTFPRRDLDFNAIDEHGYDVQARPKKRMPWGILIVKPTDQMEG